jgi:hypothetical protein
MAPGLFVGCIGKYRCQIPWQLDENGKPFAAIPDLFERLGDSGWTIYRFLVQRHPELDGLSALEALKREHAKKVMETADGVSRGNFA